MTDFRRRVSSRTRCGPGWREWRWLWKPSAFLVWNPSFWGCFGLNLAYCVLFWGCFGLNLAYCVLFWSCFGLNLAYCVLLWSCFGLKLAMLWCSLRSWGSRAGGCGSGWTCHRASRFQANECHCVFEFCIEAAEIIRIAREKGVFILQPRPLQCLTEWGAWNVRAVET